MDDNYPEIFSPGIGATDELRLRVSVAAIVRVLFEDPQHAELMLALERRATLHKVPTGQVVEVKSQPFGGALRIHELEPVQDLIGDFHFDTELSRSEQDFRLFIRPSAWSALREFCLAHLTQPHDPVLESDPTRELAEEFLDTLNIILTADQYTLREVGTILEEHPSATEYFFGNHPTVRIYRIFEARLLEPSLATAMLHNNETCSDRALDERARHDFQKGGYGRANAVLTLPFQEINRAYLAIPLERRNTPIWFQGHQLDETVAVILDDVPVPKYRRVS